MSKTQPIGNPFSGKAKTKKSLESIRLSRTADGKMRATHHFEGYDHEPVHHEFGSGAELLKHVSKAMGIKGESEA